MSKRTGWGIRAALCAFALWAAGVAPASAQTHGARSGRPRAAATADAAKAAAAAAATVEILRETSEIRGLRVLRAVKSGAQTRADIERMLLRNLDEQSKPEEMRASELVLKKLGLVPADFRLRPFTISLLTEQIVGYYDPKTQTFYLADWIDPAGQQPVIAHELTHALQDQHFNLRRFEHWRKGDADAELAAHALVEGDATLLMTQYVLKSPARAVALLKSVAALGASTEKIDAAPRALRESLLFPYTSGSAFATQLYRRGGWALVSRAFAELPQSTEQILHPDKYFAREAPVKVEQRDVSRELGANWRRIAYDVNGEWNLYLILDEFLKAPAESRQAAAGWGGDRYALYENQKTRETLLAQSTVWDTEQDAREFYEAYVRRTQRRAGLPAGGDALDADDESAVKFTLLDKGAVTVQRMGKRVAVIEGASSKANALRLMSMLYGDVVQ